MDGEAGGSTVHRSSSRGLCLANFCGAMDWRSGRRVYFRTMIIDIDLTGAVPAVDLVEPEDCRRFHVAVRGGDSARLRTALEADELGRLQPSGDAMIATAAIRRMAEGRVPAGWDKDFAAMLQYALRKGWLDDEGAMIQAHVDWSD